MLKFKHTISLFLFVLSWLTFASCDDEGWVPPGEGNPHSPVILDFSPESGLPGTEVIINGKNFHVNLSKNKVKFSGVEATVIRASKTTLEVVVPEGATTGRITVSTGHLIGISSKDFVVPSASGTEAISAGGTWYESGYGVAVDALGNTYVTGSFTQTAIFGTTPLTARDEDIFVAKYNSDGELVWVKQAGGIGPDRGTSIALDNSGDAYFTGYFTNQADFGSISVNSNGSYDAYAAKINAAGDFVWVKAFGSIATDDSYGIALDQNEDVIATGYFHDIITIGALDLTSNGASDIFVAKFNKDSGNEIWAKSFGGTEDDIGKTVGANVTGEIYLAGSFFGTIDFGTTSFTSGGGLNSFVLKLDADGTLQWTKQIVGSDWNGATGLIADEAGNCVVTGYFTSDATFDATTLFSSGSEDIFVAKYTSSDGNVVWASKAGGTSYDRGTAISIRDSDLYLTGYFEGSATFGTFSLSSSGSSDRDIFVAKYNTNGDVQEVKGAGGTDTDAGESIAVGFNGVVNVTGAYRTSPATFGTTILPNAGGDDIFLWRIFP